MRKYEINYEVLEEGEKQTTGAEELFDWVETIVVAFFAVILVFTFILRIAAVSGESMVPTLQDNDRLIVSYLFYTPKNGDIVIADCHNPEMDKVLVKRVIATEGQVVDIDFDTGVVKVDGNVLQEDYINELTMLDEGGHNYPVTVPQDCVFVMGDNRMRSADSRDPRIGFISEDDILGKVVFRIFPFNSIGSPA